MVNSFLGQDHPLNLKSARTDCLSDLRCGPDLILDIASKMELVWLSCFSKAIVLLSLWKTSETLLTCLMMSKRKGSNLHNRPSAFHSGWRCWAALPRYGLELLVHSAIEGFFGFELLGCASSSLTSLSSGCFFLEVSHYWSLAKALFCVDNFCSFRRWKFGFSY